MPRIHHVVYRGLTNTDKTTLLNFEETNRVGGTQFLWTPPTPSAGRIYVRFAAPVIYTPFEDTNYKFWIAEMDLEEV